MKAFKNMKDYQKAAAQLSNCNSSVCHQHIRYASRRTQHYRQL